ncbi:MAG: hypothetical protein FWE19_00705 [Oscillospiraceae bacterium]|nr:hypothetical protein [Oscillospiraceae bacterium]
MKKVLAVLLVVAVLLAGCARDMQELPLELTEPPVAASPPEPQTEPIIEPEPEPEPTEPVPYVPDDIRSIVAAGRFVGEFDLWDGGEQHYTTYENPLLRLRYHFDEDEDTPRPDLFIGVSPSEYSDGLFDALSFGNRMVMRLIEGDGREWVEQQVRAHEEQLVEMYQDFLRYLVEEMGYDLEQLRRNMRESRQQSDEWHEEQGDVLERRFDVSDHEELAFWPAEHLVAGLYYRGYHINIVEPFTGFWNGTSYLYAQLDHNRAVVVHVAAWNEEQVREHIARFSLLEESEIIQGS